MEPGANSPLLPIVIAAVVVLAAGIGLAAVLWLSPFGEQGSGLSDAFEYDVEKYRKIDPALIGYRQTGSIPLSLRRPRAVAVGPEDRVYVAGDRAVHLFAVGGTELRRLELTDEPQALAVAGTDHALPRHLYVGFRDHIEVYDAEGVRTAVWQSLGEKAHITSIALAEQDVFVADAGAKIVVRYDPRGQERGRLGRRDQRRNIPGFVIPSPYFDVALAPDGLLRAVNPGAHRIEAYTFDGDLELYWGRRDFGVEGFCGCCNPANIAILPDGQVVTAEKGIPRVKVYDAGGELLSVVVGPETLLPHPSAAEETRDEHKPGVVDVAVDSQERILVLDPQARQVRIFEPKPPGP